jgi:hypothetical protein
MIGVRVTERSEGKWTRQESNRPPASHNLPKVALWRPIEPSRFRKQYGVTEE